MHAMWKREARRFRRVLNSAMSRMVFLGPANDISWARNWNNLSIELLLSVGFKSLQSFTGPYLTPPPLVGRLELRFLLLTICDKSCHVALLGFNRTTTVGAFASIAYIPLILGQRLRGSGSCEDTMSRLSVQRRLVDHLRLTKRADS